MKRRVLPTVVLALLGGVASLLACKASSSSDTPTVPALDDADSGAMFDPNEIVPSAGFTDSTALAASDIQGFLERSPYSGASFLQTYQSNGILFSAAVARTAQTYRINPIVLLVAVEAQGALVADTSYPQPSAAVDFLFGCGCTDPATPTTCDPAAAGLDVQLACYANALRTSLDEVATNGETAGGWGPGKSSTSVDGVVVKPVDDSTAALYQYDPVVGRGSSGMSLFENIWLEYTLVLSYGSPEGSTGGTASIGDACVASTDCALANAICATGEQYPGGMCTSKCMSSCPGVDGFCADFTAGGYCLALCNPTVPASCRTGYTCSLVQPSGAPAGAPAQNVCTPG
jgi:hypothetical protein